MELGCGCGNLGKLISRYAAHYLGADYSTLALKIARLVSPLNCSYVHVADRASLSPSSILSTPPSAATSGYTRTSRWRIVLKRFSRSVRK